MLPRFNAVVILFINSNAKITIFNLPYKNAT